MRIIFLTLFCIVSIFLFIGCENENTPTDESGLLCEHPGTAGPGVWVVDSTGQNYPTYLVKYNFDGTLNYRSYVMHWASHMDVNHQDGSVWLAETPQGDQDNYSIVKHSQTGEVLASLKSSEVNFAIRPNDLKVNFADGSCWFSQQIIGNARYGGTNSRLVKVNSSGDLALSQHDFYYYYFVAPSPFDNSCWVVANTGLTGVLARYGENGDIQLQFPIGTSLDHLCPMVSDPRDGGLWFISNNRLLKYSTTGEVLIQTDFTPQGEGMAINPYNGDLAIITAIPVHLYYFNSQGVLLWQTSCPAATSVDIAKSGQVLVTRNDENLIEEYSPQGMLLETHTLNALGPMDVRIWK